MYFIQYISKRTYHYDIKFGGQILKRLDYPQLHFKQFSWRSEPEGQCAKYKFKMLLWEDSGFFL